MRKTTFLFLMLLCLITTRVSAQPKAKRSRPSTSQQNKYGTVLIETLASSILRDNLIGLDANRDIRVYLPPSYAASGKSYPVLYYCHTNSSSPQQLFADGILVKLLERGFENGVVKECILVAASYATPMGGGLYENSSTSGRWLDFTVGELVPFIDRKFRTLSHRNSRGLAGDFMGARGALRLAMGHSDIFSVVYAMHPVAAGIGQLPWASNPVDWKKIHQAKTFAELPIGREQLFVMMAQALLPNPNRPPFYCDFWVELENGEPKLQPANARKAQAGWHLEESLDKSAINLRAMRGIAFDWARFDPTQAHVYSNEAFSKKLEDLGIEHEAEEYRGDPWNQLWTEDGRFYARMLPFFNRYLVFDDKN